MKAEYRGICLFDNDETLVQTRIVFNEALNTVARFLNPTNDEQGITMQRINDIQSREVVRTGVDPKRNWPTTMTQLRREYKLADSQYRQALELLMSMYTRVPPIYPDALSTLEQLKEMGYRLGMVTHARRDWTKLKLVGNGLERYFPNPCIINVRGHKRPESWLKSRNHYRINEDEEVWVIGDSIRSDIHPAYESGLTKNLVWIDRGSAWVVDKNNRHLLPECAWQVRQLSEIPEIVRRGRDLNPR